MTHTKKTIQPPYLKAGERADDLIWELEDDSIKAIVCSRGGYGAIHLLERIPFEYYQQHPKWIVGHGDITILRNLLFGTFSSIKYDLQYGSVEPCEVNIATQKLMKENDDFA